MGLTTKRRGLVLLIPLRSSQTVNRSITLSHKNGRLLYFCYPQVRAKVSRLRTDKFAEATFSAPFFVELKEHDIQFFSTSRFQNQNNRSRYWLFFEVTDLSVVRLTSEDSPNAYIETTRPKVVLANKPSRKEAQNQLKKSHISGSVIGDIAAKRVCPSHNLALHR